ncbi:DUF4184 family protein [Providencia rettgeri]|uniref:DUF4184 family protein n=1 Tax=Providencia rettgeri TaxID=587 RepID=UPI0015EB6CED|nr:DUF4184 family protein [Providencia rettgeri]QLR03262.1 DUF4184 family protein [Providencia rettgeri]
MPWTFSHPAVVFPIKHSFLGKWLSLPAMILGSLSPDLLYSFGLYRLASEAHHIVGWLSIGLPLCFIIYVIILKLASPLSTVIPFVIKKTQAWSILSICILAISFFIGALTHIVWDSFTHDTGTMVRSWSFLQFNLSMTDKQEIAIYKVLQHSGSLLGLLYLSYQYWRYYRKQTKVQQNIDNQKLKKIIGIGTASLLFALPIAYYLTPKLPNFHFNRFVYLELTMTVPFFFGGLVIYGIWVNFHQYGKQS